MMKDEKDIQVVHALPGRVRIKVRQLKNNISYAGTIQRYLLEVPGITHLEANPQTGSLLIEYDSTVFEVLALHPSVSSCLGLTLPGFKQSKKNAPSGKDRSKTLKTGQKGTEKRGRQAKPKKSSKKNRGKS